MAYSATGTAGNDTLNQAGDTGPGTIVGLAGDDCILTGTGLATVTGDSGNDTVVLRSRQYRHGVRRHRKRPHRRPIGRRRLDGCCSAATAPIPSCARSDTRPRRSSAATIPADGADSLDGGSGADLIFGNGGADHGSRRPERDTLIGGLRQRFAPRRPSPQLEQPDLRQRGQRYGRPTAAGNDTAFVGLGNDSIFLARRRAAPVVFGNEGADTINALDADRPASTIVGGNDSADGGDSLIGTGSGADFIFGNGGDDTIAAGAGANTVVGGFGND